MNKLNIESKILKKLKGVMDPELYISIVDLGLVYNIKVNNNKAIITMTLTTIGCPLFSIIEKQVENAVGGVKEIDDVEILLTFDPPWNIDMMSENARATIGI